MSSFVYAFMSACWGVWVGFLARRAPMGVYMKWRGFIRGGSRFDAGVGGGSRAVESQMRENCVFRQSRFGDER